MTERPRMITVSTPLDDGVLRFHKMSGSEELGRLFVYELELLSTEPDIAFADVVGQPMTVSVVLPGGSTRYFHGFVTRFSQIGRTEPYTRYHATLRPWLWFLTRTAQCRIYQEMAVPDIIKEIFGDRGFSDIQDNLNGSYRTWEYCVQYRETDFNFVCRLMEQEGIYFYFTHEEETHTLVLADGYSSHEATEGFETVAFLDQQEEGVEGYEDCINSWQLHQEIQPGAYALTDYDFTKPKTDLMVQSVVSRDHDKSDYEVYDYPGEYLENADGDAYVQARIQELQAQHERVRGTGTVRGLGTGALFTLSGYGREDQNREYLITATSYQLEMDIHRSAASAELLRPFSVAITAIDAQQQYRSPRITPKPVVQGPQTAVVTGPSGEEIWPDEYSRIKIQFPWDRLGESDENSSCWVRVSQNWAGKNWGGMFIPHIGQEVIVEFLEGDPDRPIITGRVYNADNMPPEDLPGSKTQSIIRDHGGNEMIMEGADGSQFIHLRQTCGNEVLMNAPTPDIHVKQSDGNEMLMDPSGIQIRDSYGNEVVLDAGGGTLSSTRPPITRRSSWDRASTRRRPATRTR
jgi:type VI secretion system secreted protein VgrG